MPAGSSHPGTCRRVLYRLRGGQLAGCRRLAAVVQAGRQSSSRSRSRRVGSSGSSWWHGMARARLASNRRSSSSRRAPCV